MCAGKTLIAAEAVLTNLESQGTFPVLFLVPTRDLVQQQAQALRREFDGRGYIVETLKGGNTIANTVQHGVDRGARRFDVSAHRAL